MWFKSYKNIVHFSLKPVFYCCQRHKYTTEALLYNFPYFYIVDSHTKLSCNERQCCISTITMVRRTLQSVILQVQLPILLACVLVPETESSFLQSTALVQSNVTELYYRRRVIDSHWFSILYSSFV
jgi:hypothetical protein